MIRRFFLSVVFVCLGQYIFGQVSASYNVDGAVEKEQYRSHVNLEAVGSGTSVVYATNEVDLNLTAVRINKTSGEYNKPERRERGINSGILADGGSKVLMERCEVNTHVSYADAIAAYGDNTSIKVQDGYVRVTRSGSAGANVINGAKIRFEKTELTTSSGQSPVMIASKGGVLEAVETLGGSSGVGSPLFLSNGELTAEKCRMTASRWAIAQVDGGHITLNANELVSRSFCGVMVYSTGNTVNSGVAELNKNKIQVNEGPLFYVTNANGEIHVSHNSFSQKDNDVLVAKADDWGAKGQNGGHAVLFVQSQSLSGNVWADSISSVKVVLNKKGALSGAVNSEGNMVAEHRMVIGAGGKWSVKKDSYLNSIEFEQPLNKGLKQLKGKHTVYYDPSDPVNAPLEGKEHKIGGGGKLKPLNK
ncbi:MAG: hypothetical protein IKZ89_03610 [Bacteroidaceae bacterium]|nr:hypothetical protein [Bacteroidaceae bacterium]